MGDTQWPEERISSSANIPTVFVRHIPREWTDADLTAAFSAIGPVRRAFLVRNKKEHYRKRQEHDEEHNAAADAEHRGFGFVQFADEEDATRACAEMHNKNVGISKLAVEIAVKGRKSDKSSDKVPDKTFEKGTDKGSDRKSDKITDKQPAETKKQLDKPQDHKPEKNADKPIADTRKQLDHKSDKETKKQSDTSLDRKSEKNVDKTIADIHKQHDKKSDKSANKQQDKRSETNTDVKLETAKITTLVDDSKICEQLSPAKKHATSGKEHLLLISGLPLQIGNFGAILKAHKIVPTHIVFPAPESTLKYLAARLVFQDEEFAMTATSKIQSLIQHAVEATGKGAETLPFRKARVISLDSKASRLIIRNLPFHVLDSHLRKLLSPFGELTEITIPQKPGSTSNVGRGFAFIQYRSALSASECISKLNGQKFMGRAISVDWSLNKSDYDIRLSMQQKVQEMQEQKANAKEVDTTGRIKTEEPTKKESGSDMDENSDAESSLDVDMEVDSDTGGENDGSSESENESDGGLPSKFDDDDDGLTDEDSDSETLRQKSKLLQRIPREHPNDVEDGLTVFVRNLSFETSEEDLRAKFALYGPVRYARIVRDHNEDGTVGRSKGTGFVRFLRRDTLEKILQLTEQSSMTLNEAKDRNSKSKQALLTAGLGNDDGIVLHGRTLIVTLAVDRTRATELSHVKEERRDKRNLSLAKEGIILRGTEGAKTLSDAELERRERYYREKKKKLENPNFFVSNVRLSVRNLPLNVDEKALERLFATSAINVLRDERKDALTRLEKESEVYKSAAERNGWGERVKVKQVKIARDATRVDANGIGRSKRYGFVEFTHPHHALTALRALNDNPQSWAEIATEVPQRPIIEFAVDDVRKVKARVSRLGRQNDHEKSNDHNKTGAADHSENDSRNRSTKPLTPSETKKQAKAEAREKGTCYKCGLSGHQASRCRAKAEDIQKIKSAPETKNPRSKKQQSHSKLPQTNSATNSSSDKEMPTNGKPDTRKRPRTSVHETNGKAEELDKSQQSPMKKPKTSNGKSHPQQHKQNLSRSKQKKAELPQSKPKGKSKDELEEERFDAMVKSYQKKFTETVETEDSKAASKRWFEI